MVYTGFHETFTGLQEKSSGFHVFLHIGVDRVPFFPGNWVSDAPVFMCFATLGSAASHFLQTNGQAILWIPCLAADVHGVASSLLKLLRAAILTRKYRKGSVHRRSTSTGGRKGLLLLLLLLPLLLLLLRHLH